MPTPRETLLRSSRRLNDDIRRLDRALAEGAVPASSLEEMRRGASEALSALKAVQGGTGAVAATIPKVTEHLDLFMDIAGSTGTDPALARKLLAHLLEEQLELTSMVERHGAVAVPAAPAAAAEGGPAGGEKAGAGELLPGGRRPLTVGSLIQR